MLQALGALNDLLPGERVLAVQSALACIHSDNLARHNWRSSQNKPHLFSQMEGAPLAIRRELHSSGRREFH